MAALTNNIIGGSQDWSLLLYGLLIGIVALIIDMIGKKTKKFRCSMVSVGVGIYLPPEIVVALFIGGCIRLLVNHKHKKLQQKNGNEVVEKLDNKVNLLVCGLIAGESLMGLFLAVPFVIYQSSDALKIVGDKFTNTAEILSVIVTFFVARLIYKVATKNK